MPAPNRGGVVKFFAFLLAKRVLRIKNVRNCYLYFLFRNCFYGECDYNEYWTKSINRILQNLSILQEVVEIDK